MTAVCAGLIVLRKRWRGRPAVCEFCGRTYDQRSPVQRFCGEECRRTAMYGIHHCLHCGRSFIPTGWGHTHTHYCSRDCRWESARGRAADAVA